MKLLRWFRDPMRGGVARLGARLLVRPAAPRRSAAEVPPDPQGNDERVLLIRTDERVGNVLLTTPLLSRLEEARPRARIDFLVAASKRTLLSGNSPDRIHLIPFEKRDLFRRPWAFARQMLALRAARYDVAIDASHWHRFSLSSALLLAWTGARIRIAHERGEASAFATHVVPPPGQPEPEVRSKLRLLAPLGLGPDLCSGSKPGAEPGDARIRTPLGESGAARERMSAWLRASDLGEQVVALAPGARKEGHRASPELFRALGIEARRLGAGVIVLWGPSQGEEALARELAASTGGTLAPPTDLEELAALIRLCAVIVCNDTGPMHLAVAVGATTVALFTRPEHLRWGHAEPPHAVIAGFERDEADLLREAKAALAARLCRPERRAEG
jgi:ADP-heptose:LPS heptosyltransferase